MKKVHPLRKYRIDNGLSLQVIAVKLGVDRATVSRYETGKRKISPGMGYDIYYATGGAVTLEMLRPDIWRART